MSVTFNGTDQYLTIADDAALTLTPPWSLAFWFVLGEPLDGGYFLAWGTPGTPPSSYATYHRSDHATHPGQVLSYFKDSSGNVVYKYSENISGASGWQHLLASCDSGGTLTVYLNGDSIGTSTDADLEAIDIAENFYLGKWSGGEYFAGKLAEIAKYDTVLTADQRAELLVKPAGLISATPTWWLPCFNDLAEKTAGLTVTPFDSPTANPADHPVAYFRPAWAQNVNRCIGLGV